MKRYFVLVFSILSSLSAFAANGFTIENGYGTQYDGVPQEIDGNVFIFSEHANSIAIRFSVDDSTGFNWFEYREDPQVDAVKLVENKDFSIAKDGKSSVLYNIKANHGYFVEYTIEDNVAKKYMWIALYAPISSIKQEQSCESLQLFIEPVMEYVLPPSGRKAIERDLEIKYQTWGTPGVEVDSTVNRKAGTGTEITIPYVDTDLTITDKLGIKTGSDAAVFVDTTFISRAVTAFPTMMVSDKKANEVDPDNGWEINEDGNIVAEFSTKSDLDCAEVKFRSSASSFIDDANNVNPFVVEFVSNANPKSDWYEWRISCDEKGFTDRTYSGSQDDFSSLSYSYFPKDSTYRIQLTIYTRDSLNNRICEANYYSCLRILKSQLYIPNVFTPNGDGKNDEFRVGYTSIASFRCRIYNQWGRLVFDTTDINTGWNGKANNNGAELSIGVYRYDIEAKGTDGKVHKKKGNLNLLRSE